MAETNTYRLQSGTHRDSDGEMYEPDDEVELTDSQYDAFNFKFEPVETEPDYEVGVESGGVGGTAPGEPAEVEGGEGEGEGGEGEVEGGEGEVEGGEGEGEGGEGEVEGDDRLPDDYAELRSMAMEYEGDEINGTSSEEDIRDVLSGEDDDTIDTLRDDAGV